MNSNKVYLILTILCSCVLFISCNVKTSNTELSKAYKDKQFLQLEKENINPNDSLYHFYKAVFANVSNKPEVSSNYLDEFKKELKEIPENIAYEYWKLRNDNYVKLFDYPKAFHANEKLLTDFKDQMDSIEIEDAINEKKIWKSLINAPAQTITGFDSASIPITYDIANLLNINVVSNGIDTQFIFDTGAGISSIIESKAKELGFQFMPDEKAEVKGFTGISNPIRLAIAKELKIGSIIIKNAPFLVFKDEALTFAEGAYIINGIIGFPIAKELGTITITKTNLKTTLNDTLPQNIEKNLFIELLHPILYLKYNDQILPFNFDTGAKTSVFSKTFYEKFGERLTPKGTIEERTSASAGGIHKYNVLRLKKIEILLGDQIVTIPNLDIDMDNYHISGKELYGNIGQDLLGQYTSVTISFEHNYLTLKSQNNSLK